MGATTLLRGVAFPRLAVRDWLGRLGVGTLLIEPGSPWDNGYVESFNGKLRDELLDKEIFYTLAEGKGLGCRAGAVSTTRCGPIAHSAIGHPHPK